MAEQYANGANSKLAAAITATATSLSVVSAAGFSTAPTFRLQLTSASLSNAQVEILEVTAVSGTTFTVTRAAEAYGGIQTAYAWDAGDYVAQVLTAAALPTGAVTIPSFDTTVLTGLSLAPVAYWKLNDPVGSSTAADSSGNGYTLTVSGTVTFGEPSVVPSDSETSCKGDGSTGSLSVASASLLPVTGQYTAVACIQTPTLASLGTGYPGILAFGATYKRGFNITGNRNGSIPSGAQGPFMNANDLDDVSKVGPDGTNLLIGVTVDDASTIGYVNGRPELSMALGLQPTDSSGGATVLSLGAANYSDFPIGRVAIFAGILNPKDWALLMQAFTGVG